MTTATLESTAGVRGLGGPSAGVRPLLGLEAESAVLVVGCGDPGWEYGLRDAPFLRRFPSCETLPATSGPGAFDLVLWYPASADVGRQLHDRLRTLEAQLNEHGTLVVFVADPCQPGDLKRRPWRLLASLAVRHRIADYVAARLPARTEAYIPVPSLSTVEGYWRATRSAPPADPDPVLERNSWRHRDRVLILSRSEAGTARLIAELAAAFGLSTQLELKRFELRARGALVLVLREPNGKRLVGRVTASEEADAIVGRNTNRVSLVRSAPLGSWALERIPEQLGVRRLRYGTARLEAYVPGTLAWRLVHKPAIERRMLSDLIAFQNSLQAATAEPVAPGADSSALLLAEPTECMDAVQLAALQSLADRLARHSRQLEHTTSVAHGDYGYGNALVDPRTGALHGIIDWDQAGRDLAGVDLMNFAIQREHIMRRTPLLQAATGFAARAGRAAPAGNPQLDAVLYRDAAAFQLRFAWTLLRMVQRAARYPKLFGPWRGDALRLTSLALEVLGDA